LKAYWPSFRYTEWSKSLCAPVDCVVFIRCTETFWSPYIIHAILHGLLRWFLYPSGKQA